MPTVHIIIPWTDPRLKRQIRHDTQSKRFLRPRSLKPIQTVHHERIAPIGNQGNVGKCTAMAGWGVLGTVPFYSEATVAAFVRAFGVFDGNAGTDALYNAEETLDGDGPWPPQDNGSSGLTLAMVLRNAGIVPGWTTTLTLEDMLSALMDLPCAIGIPWYNSMFTPNAEGILTVDPSSGLAGGHELAVDGFDSARDLLEVPNSWGTDWGVGGRCFIKTADMRALLASQGDVTFLSHPSEPAPQPAGGAV